MDKAEIRERFRDQTPGMKIFDELLDRYDELLTAQKELRDKWNTMSPAKVQVLRAIIQAVQDAPNGVSAGVKNQIALALNQAGIP